MTSQPIIALIPAFQEAERISATVQAALALPGITRVVVVDDGSADDTATLAKAAGAEVIRQPQNAGKGAALRAGLAAIAGEPQDIILLLDADLGASAAEAEKLLEPVLAGEADVAIARFPKAGKSGGFGLVKGLARTGTWLLSRTWLQAPLSGQRACRRWALEAAPIADGYGAEVAMNVAAADAGARIVEVETTMTHAAKGRTLGGFKHRGRQGWHILGALLAAAFGRTGERLVGRMNPWQVFEWLIYLFIWSLLSYALFFGSYRTTLPTMLLILIFLLISPFLAALVSGIAGTRRKNFQGRFIPALGGLILLPPLVIILLAVLQKLASLPPWISAPRFVVSGWLLPVLLIGWLILGLVDDLRIDQNRKGFRGHIIALLHGQLTTGSIKMLGGGALALGMAGVMVWPSWNRLASFILAALLIALCANLINLFDLRPGRALKVFWLIAFPGLYVILTQGAKYLLIPSPGLPPNDLAFVVQVLLLVMLATFIYAPFDFAGMIMLGDTGANPLGALLGWYLALVLPLPTQAFAVVVLIGIHIYAEKASITGLIERVRWLRWLDRLGRGCE